MAWSFGRQRRDVDAVGADVLRRAEDGGDATSVSTGPSQDVAWQLQRQRDPTSAAAMQNCIRTTKNFFVL